MGELLGVLFEAFAEMLYNMWRMGQIMIIDNDEQPATDERKLLATKDS
jgi:hypothetical protein